MPVGDLECRRVGRGAAWQTNPITYRPPNATICINNYSASFTKVALLILMPGSYPGSAFSKP